MRIAINGWFSGQAVGSGQYTDRLVAALRSTDSPRDAANADLPLDPVRDFNLLSPSARHPLAKLAFEQYIFPRRAAQLACDLAHVPYWAPPLRSPVPIVVTVHDLIPLLLPEYRRDPRVRAYTALVARATAHAAAVIADSAHTAADISQHLDVPSSRIHVIPLGVNLPTFGPPSNVSLPPRFGLYLGGFDARKNLATLLTAWREVYAATSVPLLIAGRLPSPNDPLSPHPATLLQSLNLPPNAAHLLGPIPESDKQTLLASAAVFAFPSRYEGFGLPPLEAMAAGTPVVASSAASLPEVVGDTGLVVAPDDPAAWADALIRVLQDEDLSSRLSQAGRQRASTFTWSETARLTRAVYASVLSNRP